MTYKLTDGDYVRTTDGLETCDNLDEIRQNVYMVLYAERGKFYPNKEFGSQIRQNTQLPRTPYARAYAMQALDGMDGVFVTGVMPLSDKSQIYFRINGTSKWVIV